MSSLIELHGVTKEYRNGSAVVRVLNGIDLSMGRPGEAVALLGPSGSGKTTLLNLIGALDKPTGGQVEVLGMPLGTMPESKLTAYRREKVGFVFQTFNLIPNLTALENAALPMEFLGLGASQAKDRGTRLLGLVGMAHRANHTPARLSGGEQQRVAIARALANDPEIILADEPTGNLDATTGDEVVTLLSDLVRREGKTLVVVTHDQRLASLADVVLNIRGGRVSSCG